jgi:hypothetical protein
MVEDLEREDILTVIARGWIRFREQKENLKIMTFF